MSVGAFPGIAALRRRTVRQPVNPMDKSTIISIYPREILEEKWTIQPGVFHIQPGSYEKPSILVVGPSSWWREIDEDQPLLEIPNSSIQVADSVVRDWAQGMLACDMAEAIPGIDFVPGSYSMKTIESPNSVYVINDTQYSFKSLLDKLKRKQTNWYNALVRMADGFWARSNGNPLAISDLMRMAARELGINRDWANDFQMIEMIRCIACGGLRNPQFPICSHCQTVVDVELYKKLGLKVRE